MKTPSWSGRNLRHLLVQRLPSKRLICRVTQRRQVSGRRRSTCVLPIIWHDRRGRACARLRRAPAGGGSGPSGDGGGKCRRCQPRRTAAWSRVPARRTLSLAAVGGALPLNAWRAAADDRRGDACASRTRPRRCSMDSALYKAEKRRWLATEPKDVSRKIFRSVRQIFSKDDQDWKLGDFQAAELPSRRPSVHWPKLAWPGSRLR